MSRHGKRGKSARAMAPGAITRQGGAVRDRSADVVSMTTGTDVQVPPMARLMPTPTGWATMPFAPGRPLDPVPINPVRPDSGRPEPRLYEYPVSWNLTTTPQRLVPWAILRSAADGVSMFRRCIEVRKDHIRGLDWDVVIGQDALDAAQQKADRAERATKKNAPPGGQPLTGPVATPAIAPGGVPAGGRPAAPSTQPQDTPAAGRAAVEDQMRERLAPAIDKAKRFLKMPDRGNGLTMDRWLGQLLEEVFVLDALAIYPRYTRGGDELYSLEILDGSTIKPLLDDRGGRPLPPYPAYQQVLYGFPRGDFTASVSDVDGADVIDGGYRSDELIYSKRVDRVWSPYGLSAVEQALDDGSLYLKRHLWMMSEYTEGTSVSGLFTTAEATNWSPEQLLEFEVAFNRLYQGQQAERHSARFLPPGIMPVDQGGSIGSDAIAERYKPEYDMYLLKLMVSHFDTTLPEIGFTDAGGGGLGSEGYHEGQAAVQERKRLPILRFVESLLTQVMHDYMGAPEELVFRFLGLDEEDEPGSADVDQKRLAAGVITLNEQRDKLGLTRYEFPEADMAMISTGRGVVYLEGSSALEPPGVLVGPPTPPAGQPADGGATDASSPPAGGPKPAAQPVATPPVKATATAGGAQKAAEVAAYRRFVAKGARGRPFRWECHTEDEVATLVKDGGGAAPKALSPWPGWSRDLAVASHYEPLLIRALTGAIGVQALTARWAEHGGSPDAVRAWLGEELAHGARMVAALTPVLERLWTEGYLIGDVSAGWMLERMSVITKKSDITEFDHATEWGAWTPGDARAARAILEGAGRYPGLRALLDSGQLTIRSIAAHRVDELAEVLSTALEEGWSNGRTAAALREVLTDARWARMVAITEVSRASSAASLARYRANGIEAKSWMTASDQRVCPECHENEAQGDIPIGDYFQDGSDAAPGHPLCRCAMAPGWLPREGDGGVGLSEADSTMTMEDLSE